MLVRSPYSTETGALDLLEGRARTCKFEEVRWDCAWRPCDNHFQAGRNSIVHLIFPISGRWTRSVPRNWMCMDSVSRLSAHGGHETKLAILEYSRCAICLPGSCFQVMLKNVGGVSWEAGKKANTKRQERYFESHMSWCLNMLDSQSITLEGSHCIVHSSAQQNWHFLLESSH